MLRLVRLLIWAVERSVSAPFRFFSMLCNTLILNPRLGRLRFVVAPVVLYGLFALALTYVYAPIRGVAGQVWIGRVLAYADERSLGTAIYDVNRRFVGMLDPILDSEQDFNYTGKPIALPDYIAYPDHKSLHVGTVPEHYWRCLVYHEDRHLGGPLNPFGIDLFGVLKIPVSTVRRSLASGSVELGVGGSTIAMQLARIFFKTPPSRSESAADKLGRKMKEWWLAPVIHWDLARGGDDMAGLKLWAANHFPLAQRTGGQELYGVEQTSLVLFGKPAAELSIAKQYVLAAAVNQPVILLAGSDAMERTQLATWRRIVGKRARTCGDALIENAGERQTVGAELTAIAEAPPSPTADPEILAALETLSPANARIARANPIQRSNLLLPSVRYGVREELKQRFGFSWRESVRGVTLTLDAAENFRFGERIEKTLAKLDATVKGQLAPGFSLDVAAARDGTARVPDIVLAAADQNGRIVRYFESNRTATYFGSEMARDPKNGRYRPEREGRAIASIGKMLAAIAIANEGDDPAHGGWLDTRAPKAGLEGCAKGAERRLREPEVVFACSLNAPLEWRTAQVPLAELERLVSGFGIARLEPTTSAANLAKSIVVGQLAASPRTVQRVSNAILAAVLERPAASAPTLIGGMSMTEAASPSVPETGGAGTLVKLEGKAALERWLSAPLCNPQGTLRGLGDWCARARPGVTLHLAKTGTRGTGTLDPAAPDTVDLWVSGGIGFASGPAFSYVLLIGSGNPSDPWARDLYAGSVAQSLLRVLLDDLEGMANAKSQAGLPNGAPG